MYVPDVNFRPWLNDLVPGAVDANGYIDTQAPNVLAVHTLQLDLPGAHLPQVDLTGIEAFTQLEDLRLSDFSEPVTLTAWPQALRRLDIDVLHQISLPAWPIGLDYLHLDAQNGMTALPALPAGLDSLIVRYPEALPLPALPSGLAYLGLDGPFTPQSLPP
ncbi:MAG TPA: hypothetical protein VHL57_08615, partial [Flavobacteriales bacterium]|nr:hypothetical protein [Flavobacteriales bacterium]